MLNKLSSNSIIKHILSSFPAIFQILIESGKIALYHHYNSSLEIESKDDNSPVTNADMQISQFVTSSLRRITPNIAIVSEEANYPNAISEIFWLLDPIDGTKHYMQGNANYSINLALIYKHIPVIGFIYHPVTNDLFFNDLNYAYRNSQKITSNLTDSKVKILVDKDQPNINQLQNNKTNFILVPPVARLNKFAMMLSGDSDAYYIYRPSMEWDTGAVHAILKTIGGEVTDMQGNRLVYGKPMFCNSAVIVYNKKGIKNKEIILNHA